MYLGVPGSTNIITRNTPGGFPDSRPQETYGTAGHPDGMAAVHTRDRGAEGRVRTGRVVHAPSYVQSVDAAGSVARSALEGRHEELKDELR